MVAKIVGNKVLGLAFVGLLVLGLWLVYAVFTQKFTPYDKVTVYADSVGLQLPARADVKVRGALVGQVLDAEPGKDHATLTLGIDPDKIGEIPENVTASIIPKTLFGEKYVQLDVPSEPASAALTAGTVIKQAKTSIEVEKVLSDLYPLLRTVQPAELNYTLNALADALDGRGEQLGESIVTLDSYLKRFNPQVPGLIDDLKQLTTVSNTYADAFPQIAETLRNTVKTGNTLVDKQAALNTFLKQVSSFSDTATGFLDTNGANLIKLGKVSQPTAALLARYSPEFPCFLKGIVEQAPMLGTAFRDYMLHIQVEFLPKVPRGYNPNDKQVYGADQGPSCAGLPFPKGSGQAVPYGSKNSPYKIPNFRDGVDDNGGSLERGDNQRPATGFDRVGGVYQGGTPQMRALVTALAAPMMNVPADQVPGVTTLLFGPLAAGTEVSAR